MEYTAPQTGKINIALFQDDQNTPLSLGIRYDWITSKKVFVLNSIKYGQWEREELSKDFPFGSGNLTAVKILPSSEASAYKIYANGKHIYDFEYRSDGTPDKVKRVRVITHTQPVQVTQVMVI